MTDDHIINTDRFNCSNIFCLQLLSVVPISNYIYSSRHRHLSPTQYSISSLRVECEMMWPKMNCRSMDVDDDDNSNLLHLIDWILSKAINRVECARRVAQTRAHVACIHYIVILSLHHSDRTQPNLKWIRVTHFLYIISMTEETDGWLSIWVEPAIILIIQFSKHCRHVLEQRRSRRLKEINLNSPLKIIDILPNSEFGLA